MATDDFNRANAGTLGANWSDVQQHSNSATYAIVSNRAGYTQSTSNDVCVRYNAATFANDQYSQVTLVTAEVSSDVRNGPAVRCSNSAATYYAFRVGTDVGDRKIIKVVGGAAATTLASDTVIANLNDVLRLEVVGNTLTAKVNGVTVLQHTDSSSPIASGWAGIAGRNIDTGNHLDSWEGGDLAAAGNANLLVGKFGALLKGKLS